MDTDGRADALRVGNIRSYLKVINRKLQHVSEDITEYLSFPLDKYTLIVQRLDHFWFYLETNTHKHTSLTGSD